MQETMIALPKTVIKLSSFERSSGLSQLLIDNISASKSSEIEIDFSGVELIRSTELMSMASAVKIAQESNRKITLHRVPPAVRLILEITRLDCIVAIAD